MLDIARESVLEDLPGLDQKKLIMLTHVVISEVNGTITPVKVNPLHL